MLQRAWRLPLRKLVLAMPITLRAGGVRDQALTDLDWTQSFLVGALLSPTDPCCRRASSRTAGATGRAALAELESGLNDGLALPAVLGIRVRTRSSRSGFVWWKFVLQT